MTERKRLTTMDIKGHKNKSKLVCLTAYDYSMARLLDQAGIHIALVGDSLGMTVLGYQNTLPVTMDDMVRHSAAVVRGTKRALVVGDMPFLSYTNPEQALENAGRFIQEAGVQAVKLEGGTTRVGVIEALIANGIPVMGHIGLTPQSVHTLGGFKVQGGSETAAQRIIDDALALEKAGVFALVLECIPPSLAKHITAALSIPTIGIGAGPSCDGQILVTHDMLGWYHDLLPRFTKHYANLGQEFLQAVQNYKKEVEDGKFPAKEHCYGE